MKRLTKLVLSIFSVLFYSYVSYSVIWYWWQFIYHLHHFEKQAAKITANEPIFVEFGSDRFITFVGQPHILLI